MMAEFQRNWRVSDRDSTDTCQIADLKAGGERATKTAQSTYWSCCDMIRTQILNWSKKCWLLRSGFWVETCCNSSVPGWNWTRNWPGNLDPLLTLPCGCNESVGCWFCVCRDTLQCMIAEIVWLTDINRTLFEGKDVCWCLSQSIPGIFHETDTNNQVMLYS